jgi:hypothetical protein
MARYVRRRKHSLVIAGLVPAIPIREAQPCHFNRDGRDKPGHDVERIDHYQR